MFRDRVDAGRRLAGGLERYRGRAGAIVLAVPRGGLPVGAEVARALGLPLDALLVKKIGHPANPECAVGAVSLTGEAVDPGTLARAGVPAEYAAAEVERLRADLRRRSVRYRGAAPPPAVSGRTVILVDDGAATGLTLLAAVDVLRRERAGRIVVAVPVASAEAAAALRARADELVCLLVPPDLDAIGRYYADFSQVSDEEAVALLRDGAAPAAGA